MHVAPEEEVERPVPAPFTPPPGGDKLQFVEPPDGLSVEQLSELSREYIHGSKTVDQLAVGFGVTSRDVRHAIKRYGFDRKKAEIVAQVQQEELAAYAKFLLDNRVPTAVKHLEISNKLNDAVDKILTNAAAMTQEELAGKVTELKNVAGLFRSLAETVAAASTVGARSVALSGLTSEQAGGMSLASFAGKKPLVSMSFHVEATQAPVQQPKAIDAEFTEVRD